MRKHLIHLIILLIVHESTIGQKVTVQPQFGHYDNITALSISPDYRYIASGDSTGSVKVWNIHNGLVSNAFFVNQSVTGLGFSQNKHLLAITTIDQIKVVNTLTNEVVFIKEMNPLWNLFRDSNIHLWFNKESNYLFICSSNIVKIYDLERKVKILTKRSMLARFVDVQYVKDRNYLFIKKYFYDGRGFTYEVFDINTGKKKYSLSGGWIEAAIANKSTLIINHTSHQWSGSIFRRDFRDPIYNDNTKYVSKFIKLNLEDFSVIDEHILATDNKSYNKRTHPLKYLIDDDKFHTLVVDDSNNLICCNDKRITTFDFSTGKFSNTIYSEHLDTMQSINFFGYKIYELGKKLKAINKDGNLQLYYEDMNYYSFTMSDLQYNTSFFYQRYKSWLRTKKPIPISKQILGSYFENEILIQHSNLHNVKPVILKKTASSPVRSAWIQDSTLITFSDDNSNYWDLKTLDMTTKVDERFINKVLEDRNKTNFNLNRNDILKSPDNKNQIDLRKMSLTSNNAPFKSNYMLLKTFLWKDVLLSAPEFLSAVYSKDSKNVAVALKNKMLIFSFAPITMKRKLKAKKVRSACFDSTNRYILTVEQNSNKMKYWDIEKGELANEYIAQEHIAFAKLSSDEKYITSVTVSGIVSIWDKQTERNLISIFSNNKKNAFIYSQEGHYKLPKENLNIIGFRLGEEIYPPEQFDVKYNRPDRIFERAPYADTALVDIYRKIYKKRIQKMNFTEKMLSEDWEIPEIEITNKDDIFKKYGYSTTENEIELFIEAKDKNFNIDRLNVWVNSVPIYGINGVDLKSDSSKQISRNFKIILANGINKIQVSVHNQKGAESTKATINIEHIDSLKKCDLYLVSIGASEYKERQWNLKYAVKDAEDISNLFLKETKRYKNIHSIKVLNKEVTIENLSKIKQQLMRSDVNDQVILFYAGHGLLDDELNYYLATYNMDFNNPSIYGMSFEKLEGILDSIPARKKIMLIDACHSGEVDKDEEIVLSSNDLTTNTKVVLRGAKPMGFKPKNKGKKNINVFDLMKKIFADLRRGTGTTIISSAGGGEFAYEGKEWQNGVFTYSILEGLTSGNADINKNGNINISELQKYVFEKVSSLTKGLQTPTSRQENLEYDYEIW